MGVGGGLHELLELCVDARVMLLCNINTPLGLVNGALGTVHSFSFDENHSVTAVNILFDDSSVGQTLQLPNSNVVSIERIEHTFIVNDRTIVRSQFSLTLSWACTIHKVQGFSMNHICTDIGSSVFEKGLAYVALSRVKMLSGLYLLKINPSLIQPPSGVLEEYDRLRHL